jgi:alpha-L-fucosidase
MNFKTLQNSVLQIKYKNIIRHKIHIIVFCIIQIYGNFIILAQPRPSKNQWQWHQLETYAFIHFGINTFTDKEWGLGNENPSLLAPTELNTDQWAKVVKDAGLKAIILTCKHHDGFALWPSQYTKHNISESNYKNGKGDIVGELAASCKKYGLKFGIYLSPWDRNHAQYGQADYINYYRNQLKELFAKYGPVFEMWFDGANGGEGYYGGANEKRRIDGRHYYDWPTTINLVKGLEPNILFFSDAGPDIRWVGNERGLAGTTNWNSISPDTLYAGKAGIELLLNTGHEDGSNWIPAEVDVSIRPGWFWHEAENNLVKSPEKLFEIYLNSVGRGSNLLLNIPPDRRGLIHENDIKALMAWRKIIDETFANNLSIKAKVLHGKKIKKLNDNNLESYRALAKNTPTELRWPKPQTISFVEISEYLPLGQNVKKIEIQAWIHNSWQSIAVATTIGYKRILKLNKTITNRLRLIILDSKGLSNISEIKTF